MERAEEILATWEAEGVLDTAKSIQLLDLVYPLIYAAALGGLCLAAGAAWSRAGRPSIAATGRLMAWAATLAALFDYVENLGLGVSLWGDPASPWPQLAFAAAVAKFALIFAALIYAASGIGALISARGRPTRPEGSAA